MVDKCGGGGLKEREEGRGKPFSQAIQKKNRAYQYLILGPIVFNFVLEAKLWGTNDTENLATPFLNQGINYHIVKCEIDIYILCN